MNSLYEALEVCLQDIENGTDIETVLLRYPELADELRPILEASLNARNMAVPTPSADVVRRNRAKVLQQAAQMREAKAKSSQRIWFASLRRLAVTLAIVALLFVSGTGLVRAASTTLPGDNLYPVKRTWEDVLLAFTFNVQQRDALEVEHENERLHELQELFAEGRSAKVDFAGSVTSQNRTGWMVSGVSVVISVQTEMPDQPVKVGSAVRVVGVTQSDGTVLAERVRLLPPDAELPDVEHEAETEAENNQGLNQQSEDNSGKGAEGETPQIEETKSSEPESERKEESFDGVVNSIDNDVWVVNNIPMDVNSAEINGTPTVGAAVKVEGYYNADGVFIVTKIEFENDGSGSGSGSGSDDNSGSSGSSSDSNENDSSSQNSTENSSESGHD